MLKWHRDGDGYSATRYRVIRAAPRRWLLIEAGRVHSFHGSASGARATAEAREGSRVRNARLARLAIWLVAVVATMVLVPSIRYRANPDRPLAEAVVQPLERARLAIDAGRAEPADYPVLYAGITGAAIELFDGELVNVLVTEAAGECYGLSWGPQRTPRVRVMVDSIECRPTSSIVAGNEYSFTRQTPGWSRHLPWVEGVFDWEDVLPPREVQRQWFLPAVIGGGALIVSISTRAIVTVISTPPRGWSGFIVAGPALRGRRAR